MTNISRRASAVLALTLLGSLFAMQTRADCSSGPAAQVPGRPGLQFRSTTPGARFTSAAFFQVSNDQDWNNRGDAPIVGLWKSTWLSDGNNPNGPPLNVPVEDGAYVTFHSDGTELMNSNRPSISGNFCMGVWQQTGRSSFKVNHWAMAYDPTGTVLQARINIREEVRIGNSGDRLTGTFSIQAWSPNELVKYGDPVTGNIRAVRINAD